MEPAVDILPTKRVNPSGLNPEGHKRLKLSSDGLSYSAREYDKFELKEPKNSNVVDYSDPFAIPHLMNRLNGGRFGSVTKEMQDIVARRMQALSPYFAKYPRLLNVLLEAGVNQKEQPDNAENQHASGLAHLNVINLEEDRVANDIPAASLPIVIIDSDEEDDGNQKQALPFQEVTLTKTVEQFSMMAIPEYYPPIAYHAESEARKHKRSLPAEDNASRDRDRGVYVGVKEEENHAIDDGLEDIWREMSMSLECSKDVAVDPQPEEEEEEDKRGGEDKAGGDCDHSFVLKDDLGYVCRVCGIIGKGIDTIFEFQYAKVKRNTRTYMADSWNTKERGKSEVPGFKLTEDDLVVTGISAHPRHMKQMKPHQVEGFNFLVRNLVDDNPGGCILAHAPGSGKTFMIISFMQSFLAKYPNARPLVVLPKGILAIWKKEFQIWQVEDIPLYDFYTVKADGRSQQLEVLKQWVEQKSILFLGYKQFSSIICDCGTNTTSVTCQEILLKAPSILILDEGHTPRNENTDVLQSLAKVQTPRKVVLSGTLYQNHVKEVFNILNLVRPKFLRLENSRGIVKRIMSRVNIPAVRKQFKAIGDAVFYDVVEHTLQKDLLFKRKVAVIQDLREMTSNVLHYYKGDFLDELPGLVDFTVVLTLTSRQKHEADKLKRLSRKFKISSVGSAIYLHPKLKSISENLSENSTVTDYMMDEILEKLDVKDGVKTKFFLNMVNLCESSGEKLLVFSQYIPPLKFLERLAAKKKGWSLGREMFVITGESKSEQREESMERFNNSPEARVFFGSIKACGEGISLVGASRIIILDVHLNPSVTRQAIGRAFRPGQKKKVFAYRLVAADSPEEEDHHTCFRKELISRMWFEWNEYCGYRDFDVETVDVKECGDLFLESPFLREDVKVLYKR
ncbi:hypothetical protein L6164_035529 [Bauhinia variegata]|uniref:Uncharacterized protein n=1 Tax=Bauhinia variegata TaxID=167791 RepID=A0ACB9KE99_BAUVA|nr:hypothetical protein L6164_035529 [Bauhinia variegata]